MFLILTRNHSTPGWEQRDEGWWWVRVTVGQSDLQRKSEGQRARGEAAAGGRK